MRWSTGGFPGRPTSLANVVFASGVGGRAGPSRPKPTSDHFWAASRRPAQG
jgi:hypothetical protein